jgi:hypothetical protein
METKEELITTIREWVKLDNEIRTLQKEQSKRKTEKNDLSTKLMEVMKRNNIDSFDTNNGHIQYNKKIVKKPITKKNLLNILAKYYEGDNEKANTINTFILENREEVEKEEIIRKIYTSK